jgi:pimeloyl-ACP methyl ester carboxylesterase
MIERADAYKPVPEDQKESAVRYEIYRKVWPEADSLRRSGELIKLAGQIQCPVTAIHGDYDPHPWRGVREPLSRILKNFRFILLKKCGHKPWIEKQAKERFFEILRKEIRR